MSEVKFIQLTIIGCEASRRSAEFRVESIALDRPGAWLHAGISTAPPRVRAKGLRPGVGVRACVIESRQIDFS